MPDMNEWGRIAEDGTVYVRTADGERAIGSWQAGSTEEGIAYYTRRYDDLAAEIGILEARIESPTADPKAVAAGARKLREALSAAGVLGDLGALDERLGKVLERTEARLGEQAAQRAAAAEV